MMRRVRGAGTDADPARDRVAGTHGDGRDRREDVDRVPNASVSDPLVHALARYVEALHRRYPDGPAQLRGEALDARANMPVVPIEPKRDSAA
jgi:hypothetical protein